jgi:uncharacterized protein
MAARRSSRSPINPLGTLVFTVGVVLLGVVLYATTQLLTEPMPMHWVGNPPPMPEEAPEAPLPDRIAAVTKRLESGPLKLGTPAVEPQGSGAMRYEHRRYEVALPPEDAGVLRAVLELARGGDSSVVTGVDDVEGGQRGEIGIDGLLTHTVLVRWRLQPTPAPARVAIVIDDMGNNLLAARDVLALSYPVAVAVLPSRPFSREVAESAYQRGREVLLHLPMEAQGGEEHGEVEVLRVTDAPDQVAAAVERNLAAVPHVIGVNNHMGSRFTQDPERMRVVLEHLRQHKLFFLDSATSARSSGRGVAEALGVPYVARKVFLDDAVDENAIRERLQELLTVAKRDGQAVAIGHPHAETLAALQGFGDAAKQDGVEIVPLSTLVGTR